MIHESKYWKDPLLRAATWLSNLRVSDDELGEKSLVRAEREIFIGFYAIRKLLETFKISKTTKELKLELFAYKAKIGKLTDYFNRTEIDKLFELDQPMKEQRDIGFLCNQVVHSYVFLISINDDGKLEGFFISSDSMRYKKLYFIELAQVINVFRIVGKDYPANMHLQRNAATGQWEAHE